MKSAQRTRQREQELLLFAAIFLLEILILGALARRHHVNPDEGFYVLAGWRVLDGQQLYRDFFFPQMPYLPYLEAAVLAFSGPSLLAMRLISVVGGAVVSGLLAMTAARRSGSLAVGIVIGLACLGNALFAGYLSIVKTYGLSNLALVVAFLAMSSPGKPRRSLALVAGLSAGIAVGTRLPALAAVLVLAGWALVRGRRFASVFFAAALLASLPWLWSVWDSPQNFWFSNFGFHALRREITGMIPVLTQKGTVLAKWILLPQNLVLWLGSIGGLVIAPEIVLPALACVAALAVAYLAATPTYLDYMVQILPFLLIASVPAIPRLLDRRLLLTAVVGFYAVGFLLARRVAPDDSERGTKAQLWNMGAVSRIAAYVRDNSEPGERILSWWEGYPFLAGREGYAGVGFWESNAARKLSADQRRQYHLLHVDDLVRLVSVAEPRMVLCPVGTWDALLPELERHYDMVKQFGTVRLFARRGTLG